MVYLSSSKFLTNIAIITEGVLTRRFYCLPLDSYAALTVIKLFSCSTQLSMIFELFMNIEIAKTKGERIYTEYW